MRVRWMFGSVLVLAMTASLRGETPLGTGFTFQGQLKEGGVPLDGTVDLQFTLWDAAGSGSPPTGGVQIGESQFLAHVAVVNGLFRVLLNAGGEFRGNAFNGEARWLQVEVCPDADCRASTILAPRQALTATPYAVAALGTVGLDGHSLDAADGIPTDALFVNDIGRVGIGTVVPENTLHILKGSAGVVTGHANAPLVIENSTNAYINLLTPDTSERGLLFGSPTPGLAAGGIIYNASSLREGLQFRTGGNVNRMVIDSSGDVGIGLSVPNAKLDVWTTSGRSVSGGTASTVGIGVEGLATAGSGYTYGGRFESVSPNGTGIRAEATAQSGFTHAGYFVSHANGSTVIAWNTATSGNTTGVFGGTYSPDGWGVFADGKLGASGTKSFRIDHPDDPENKYLLHYSTESPEVLNAYSGTILLDGAGEAVVELPHYFAKINKDPRYTLTAVGAPMPQLHVADEIDEAALSVGATAGADVAAPTCSFRIAGGAPGTKVSWRVEAVRNDLWVQNRAVPMEVMRNGISIQTRAMPVEVEKQGREKGTYQRPEFYGQPPEKGTNYHEARESSQSLPAATPR